MIGVRADGEMRGERRPRSRVAAATAATPAPRRAQMTLGPAAAGRHARLRRRQRPGYRPARTGPAAGGCSPGRSSSGQALPAPDTVRVNVYNATSRQGLPGPGSPPCGPGVHRATVGNDPQHRHLKGRGEIRYGARGALAAQTARVWMAGARLVRDHRRDATIDLVAGKRFSGLRSPAAAPGRGLCRRRRRAWAGRRPPAPQDRCRRSGSGLRRRHRRRPTAPAAARTRSRPPRPGGRPA